MTTLSRSKNRRYLSILFSIVSFIACPPSGAIAQDFDAMRQEMVAQQLQGRDIEDTNVLKAMGTVQRHHFVPTNLQRMAYHDRPLPIGQGQTISQPYIVALMSQVLEVKSGQKILEIGTGSGYQAAVLTEMGASVFSLEIVPELGRKAIDTLHSLGYTNIKVKIGDGYQGWPEHAPFDAIIVTCAPTRVPEPLKEQLAEGGKMVIPVGEKFFQRLVLLSKEKGKIEQKAILDVRFVPMVNEKGKTY
jgi:protein-L-isoaspartate(D-aspartate) O-methyltransferase